MSRELGFEERTYFNIGEVGKHNTLYSRDAFEARLTLDSKSQYTLVIPEDTTVDFMGIMNIVNRIFTTRNEKMNKMIRNPDGSFRIETLMIPQARAIKDSPQA